MSKTPWQEQNQVRLREAAAEVVAALGQYVPLSFITELLDLDDPEPWIRCHALSALATHGQAAPIEALLRILSNRYESELVRHTAMETLGILGTDDAVRILSEYAVARDETELRCRAIRVLGNSIARPSPELLSMVVAIVYEELPSDEEFHGVYHGSIPQSAAIHTLKRWGPYLQYDARLIRRLIEFALTDISGLWECRDEASDILKACPASSGHVEQLIDMWQRDVHLDLRQSAAYMLECVTAPVPLAPFVTCLYDQIQEIRLAAISMLGRRYTNGDVSRALVLEHLLPLLDDSDEMVRWYTIMSLGELGHEAPSFVLETLEAVVRGNDDYKRHPAIWLLRRLGPQVPIETFVEALRRDHWVNRADIVEALGEAGSRAPIDTLVDVLLDNQRVAEPDELDPPGVRIVAAQALGKLGERAPLEPLISIVRDERFSKDRRVRAATLEVLGKLGNRAPLDVIEEAFLDEDDSVRAAAAKASFSLGERASRQKLVAAVGDSWSEVRRAALKTLKHVAPDALLALLPEAEAILRHNDRSGSTLMSAWHRRNLQSAIPYFANFSEPYDPRVVAKVGQMLDWHYWEVRVVAVNALGAMKHDIPADAIQRLRTLQDDPAPAVRKAANRALVEISSATKDSSGK